MSSMVWPVPPCECSSPGNLPCGLFRSFWGSPNPSAWGALFGPWATPWGTCRDPGLDAEWRGGVSVPRPEQRPPAPNRTVSMRSERPKRDRMSNGKTRLQQRREDLLIITTITYLCISSFLLCVPLCMQSLVGHMPAVNNAFSGSRNSTNVHILYLSIFLFT